MSWGKLAAISDYGYGDDESCGQCLRLKDLARKGAGAFALADSEQQRSTIGGRCGSIGAGAAQ